MRVKQVVGVLMIGLATVAAAPLAVEHPATKGGGNEDPLFVSKGCSEDEGGEIEQPPVSRHRRAPLDLDGLMLEVPAIRSLAVSYEEDRAFIPARAASLAFADFDEDGVPDLVAGYASTEGGVVTMHRGNIDSIFPHSREPGRRRPARTFTAEPFLSPARVFEAPSAPDFMAAGDFDNDGHADVIVGARGDIRLHLLVGDGKGNLAAVRGIAIHGALTTMIGGEIYRRDGLPDVILGVIATDGPKVVVLQGPEGALGGEPAVIPIASEVRALALARLDDDPFIDLVVAAGSELLMVPGLALGGDPAQSSTRLAAVSSPITAIAWGDFAWESVPRGEVAVLTEDGFLHVLSGDQAWAPIGERRVLSPGGSGSQLLRARLSGLPTDDLVIVGAAYPSISVLAGMMRDERQGLETDGVLTSRSVSSPIMAVLPMRLTPDALTDLVVLDENASGPSLAATASRTTITVNASLDSAVEGDTLCTLREAILNANTDSDTTSGDCAAGSGADAIHFSIGGGGSTATIAVSSPLPEIVDAVTIEGATQGCSSTPCVVLDGSGAGEGVDGLLVAGGSSTIRGLVVRSFGRHGIFITSSANIVEGNYSGTDVTGTVDQGNVNAGLRIEGSDNIIGGTTAAARNVLSGNDTNGIFMTASVTGNRIQGNFIGTDVSGAAILPNGIDGIRFGIVTDNTIGGTEPGARNIVSGNTSQGIRLSADASANIVQGNYIGTDVTGTVDLGNSASGIGVVGGSNSIGGTSASARNIISGNGGNGVYMPDPAQSNQVLGNFIGTDVTGTVALGNGSTYPGVWVSGVGNTIGGTSAGARNIISGNPSSGVYLNGSGHQVLGNYVGTDVSGTIDLGNGVNGITIVDGQNNTVGGTTEGARNVVSGNEFRGVFVFQSEAISDGNSVVGNFIGTDMTGTVDLGNNWSGIEVDGGSTSTTIGGTSAAARNIISGNEQEGVFLDNTSQSSVLGNYIGTDVTGSIDLGNTGSGVRIHGGDNTIGGTSAGARNIISGNSQDGIFMTGLGAQNNQVLGNYIGTDVTGTVDLGNEFNGVEFQNATNNTIGGDTPGARNVVSGNAMNGVHMGESSDISVLGNFIGTDATGTVDLGNAWAGVRMVGSFSNTIGGTSAGARNVISGNDTVGVRISRSDAYDNVVLGNYIGTDVTGREPLGNLERGVEIAGGSNNTIGGAASTDRNVIAYNFEEGIVVESGIANAMLGNSIFSNGLMGVDLGVSDGVTPNDPKDNDTGPNDLQNYPVLTRADATPGPDLTVEGSLDSSGNTSFRIEFFANYDCDASGCGEGERFIGFTDVTTGGNGQVDFNLVLPASVSDGESIAATATDPVGNTSELSACHTATCSSLASFGEIITAQDKDTLVWTTPQDVRFCSGDLANVGSYTVTDDWWLVGASSHDISEDDPSPGSGLYYLVKPLGCGSWQTTASAEPDRDTTLP